MAPGATGRWRASAYEDPRGRCIGFHRYGDGPVPDEFEALVSLYRGLDPAVRNDGIPPAEDDAIRGWLQVILVGHSVVAWHGTTAVGHVVLVPDGLDDDELAIFVHQDYHDAGIGGRLVAAVLAIGSEHGVDRVNLLTTSDNRPMLNLAHRNGFAVTERGAGQLVLSTRLSRPETDPATMSTGPVPTTDPDRVRRTARR